MPLPPEVAAHLEEDHHDIQGGGARAAVFGISDGLVSNVSLILGMAGADSAPSVVRLAGIAGLIAGAISMGAGEYVSMRAQRELLEAELEMERDQLVRYPDQEKQELISIYEARGIDHELAVELADQLSKTPEMTLETHARDELGLNPDQLGSPWQAALSSFFAFVVGAFLPLIPWLAGDGGSTSARAISSVVIGGIAALLVGAVLARFTGRNVWFSAGRQFVVASIAAGATFFVGTLVGTTVA